MLRFYKFPKWLKGFYPGAIWDFFCNDEHKTIYLTFDDGPTPEVTEWVLNLLDKYNAKATFFCLGENVKNHPNIFRDYLERGHRIGNHTMNHLQGYKTELNAYVKDVNDARQLIDSKLFRPPYGKCTFTQHKELKLMGYSTIFWSHLSYDFDNTLTSEKRIKKLKKNVKSGSILVFHDSLKAFPQLRNDLPIILEYLRIEGFSFKAIKV
jgi:peptidoglycan/xylan/chitin deacetylase (PgdA/CDA1 family)